MLIRSHDLTVQYAATPILDRLSFEIGEGAFIGIIGPNGSGKTTLLKTLAGLLIPAQGAVEVDGRPLDKYTPLELAALLGVVPQGSRGDFAFTVRELVAMGGYAAQKARPRYHPAELETKVDQALAELDLLPFAQRQITTLSGGEWQRVLIARALVQNPKILLLDEITTHLDIRYKLNILDKVHALNRSTGLTVVAVLHELELAAQFCTQLLLLKDGHIHAFGPPREVLTSERIAEVFGVEMQVSTGAGGQLILQPLIHQNETQRLSVIQGTKQRVHIICGGGSGVSLIRALVQGGYQVSLGAVNREDADWEIGFKLGLEVAEEIPFAPLSPEVRQENRSLMEKAEMVIITDLPFGPGNLGNLEDALQMARTGKRVLLVDDPPIGERDFTQGRAQKLWITLKEAGAQGISSYSQLWAKMEGEE